MAVDAKFELVNSFDFDVDFVTQDGFLKEPEYVLNILRGRVVVTREYDSVLEDLCRLAEITRPIVVKYDHDNSPVEEILILNGIGDIVRYQAV